MPSTINCFIQRLKIEIIFYVYFICFKFSHHVDIQTSLSGLELSASCYILLQCHFDDVFEQ